MNQHTLSILPQYKASNQKTSHLNNKLLILNALRHESLSRAELADISGLTRAAITGLVDQLIQARLVYETSPAKAKMGRKPLLLALNPQYALILAMNISRRDTTIGLADYTGQIIVRQILKGINPGNFADRTVQAFNQLLKDQKLTNRRVLALGITSPGPLDKKNGIILDPPDFDKWHEYPIVKVLTEAFHHKFPVLLENNATASAMAEYYMGEASRFSNFMVLTVDSGIGGGLFINRQPYSGSGDFGNEIGHTTIDYNGPVCACGAKGCIEKYAAIPNIIAYGKANWHKWLSEHEKQSAELADNSGTSPESWKEVVDRAEADDFLCGRLIETEASYLTAALINLKNLLEPHAVIVSGDIAYKPSLLLTAIDKRLNSQSITRKFQSMTLLASKLDLNAGLASSTALVIQHQFSNQDLIQSP